MSPKPDLLVEMKPVGNRKVSQFQSTSIPNEKSLSMTQIQLLDKVDRDRNFQTIVVEEYNR
jgi:hypothetical protein